MRTATIHHFRLARILAFAAASSLLILLPSLNSTILGQEKRAKFEPPSGKMKSFGKALDMIEIEADGQKLKPKFTENSQEGMQKFQAIRSKMRVGGGGSRSSGNDTWSANMGSGSFTATAGFGIHPEHHQTEENTFWVRAGDSGKNKSASIIEAKKDGTLKADLTANNGELLFRFRQSKQGTVYCQEFSQSEVFSGAGQTFDDFCQKHPDYVQKRLGPIFTYLGLGAPPNRYSDIVAKNVVAELRPVDEKRLENFEAAIEGLNSEDFEEREKASETLEASFSDWQDMIQTAINDTKYSVETRARLKKILKNSVSEKEVGDLQIAQKGNLQDDPVYLIWLLGRTSEKDFEVTESDKKTLVSNLEEVTGVKHGDDLDKWKSWISENQPTPTELPKATMTNEEIASSKGQLEKAGSFVEKLIRLKCEEGKLAIDRDNWTKTFDGKTIKELTSEAEKMIKDRNLPSDWFKPGGNFSIESTGYPQVLFESIKTEFPAENENLDYYYRHHSQATRNRSHQGKYLIANLRMHEGNGSTVHFGFGGRSRIKVPKEEYLELELIEKNREKRAFNLRENTDGSMIISLEFPKKDAFIRIIQNKKQKEPADNKFLVFDARGAVAKSYSAESYLEFKTQETDYFESVLEPILKKLNIQIEETTP